MKKTLRNFLVLMLIAGAAQAQFSPGNITINVNLNRGASPANDTIANGISSKFYESPSSGSSSYNGRFFPNITDAAYRLRAICYPTDGQFNLSGDVLSLKQSVTATGGAKFAAYNIANAAPVVKFSFTLDLTGFTGNNVNALIFALGNASGGSTLISSSAPFSLSGDIFGAFRIIKSGSIVTQYKSADGSTQTNTAKYLIKPLLSQTVEIFANSTTSPVTYRYKSTDTADSTILANTYNVYVNGEKYVENFPKVGTTYTQTNINAIAISLAGSTSGTAETVKISNLQVTYPSATLPVSLTSFTGQKDLSGIRLNWKTASELNNDHFDVLRSVDGKNFNTLTNVNGNGTANQLNTYSYLDNAPAKGTNYYQLKQVDKDGSVTTFANVVAVKNGLSDDDIFSIQLTGSNDLKAQFYAASNGTANISITDLSGRNVFNQSISTQKGLNNASLQIPSLNAGIYVATLSQNGKSKSIKIVK
nr:T9SS type A sorting domain-containing protein [uncultured Pedobacter sp.]